MHWLRMGWRRSPRSSAGRRLREISGRTPIRLHSLPRSSGPGAAAVSILVDERFAGSIDDLRAARAAAQLPLLAKGFFTEERQLDELEAAGADAALLILRDLDDRRAAALMAHAATLGLDTLVEAHDADELARAGALGADPIGVNARDLATFAIDRSVQLDLVARAPHDRVVVAESAIHSRGSGRGGGARRRRRGAGRDRL